MSASIRYRLTVDDMAGKRFGVELDVDRPGPSLRLRMPTWVPGSYLIREYAGHVPKLEASSEGGTHDVCKEDKSTWVVDCGEAETVHIRYTVYAPELTVRTNDITHDHAFAHSPGVFVSVDGREQEPVELLVDPPGGWSAYCGLPSNGSDGFVFLAKDYDHLVDCPIEMGPMLAHRFEAAATPHELVIHGEGNHDLDRMLEDTKKIVEHEAEMFGGLPYERYLFILHLTHDRGGGLEHDNSSALAWPKLRFRPEKEYHKFLTLVAHELFHVWQVRRIRPEVLLDYDYTKETYTRLLWAFEGITSYYDELIPLRAGCYGVKDYLGLVVEHLVSEQGRPGRKVQTLGDSSFDTWIKLYRPSPDAVNSQVSYYEKGSMVAWLLDLLIRRETDHARCLDDVLRYLWNEVYRKGQGIPEAGLAAMVQAATGVDVGDFLHEHVDQASPLAWEEPLAGVGLRLSVKEPDKDAGGAWLGAGIEADGATSRLTTVLHGGPAHAAQLMSGDEIVALDGHRVRGDLEARVKSHRPGERVRVSAFRRDRLLEATLEFSSDPNPPLEILPVETPSEAQKQSFEKWLGVGWDESWAKADD